MSDGESRAMEAKQELIGAMRQQHEELHGRAPTAKEARKIEEKARQTAERCERNKTYRYDGGRR